MFNVVGSRPIRWDNLRADEAERIVREWSTHKTESVQWSRHVRFERSQERGITIQDALSILRTGYVMEAPKKNNIGDWEVIMEKRLSAGRDACAVTIVVRENETLVVKTVMWKDRK